MAKLCEANSLDVLTKQKVLALLGSEGYATYARRLKNIDFHVAYYYKGSYCPAAFMSAKDMCIVVNPGFTVDMMKDGPIFKQLSVVVRHELLHFLLCHQKRFFDYLKKTDPDFAKTYRRADMNTLANFAMDYELGNYGYDDYDKQVVKQMSLNGQVISGLLSEDVKNDTTSVWGAGIINGREVYNGVEFNNWGDKSMEEMFQMLRDAHEKLMKTKGPQPPQQPRGPKQPPQGPDDSDDPDDPEGYPGPEGDPQDSPVDSDGSPDGPDGPDGPEGNPGKGPDGGDGPDGSDGSQGDQGDQGDQGGSQGEGSQGDPGEEQGDDQDGESGHDQVSDEFAAAWNEILAKYDNDNFSANDLEKLASQIRLGILSSL